LSQRAADMGIAALPQPAEIDRDEAGLILAHGRTFAHFHAFYDHGRALPTLAARGDTADLWIAPEDAADRGILDTDPIELSNARGSFAARAKVTPRIPKGTVWIRDGWPGLNTMTDSKSVLPLAALDTFPFSVGQSRFGPRIEVRSLRDAMK
jgi:anaerobic selenocysteine-containing dehydrogenase